MSALGSSRNVEWMLKMLSHQKEKFNTVERLKWFFSSMLVPLRHHLIQIKNEVKFTSTFRLS